jgi:formyltetrahydrofolate deformylase
MHAQDAHTPTPHPFCLTLTCPSEPGQVAAVVGFLDRRGGYVDELAVFDDKSKQRFFLRCIFHGVAAQPLELDALKRDFADIAARFDMSWQVYDLTRRPRVIIMVSRLDHCLADLLFRWRMDELRMDIAAIVSNHPDLLPLAREHAIAFHHLPVTPQTKPEQEARLLRLVEDSGADLVVLARYMQVLSPDATARLAGRAINIHHSFLPGFKGARPYHQAFERGVKLIGATAHFVTGDLDEGPIIEQMVDRVDHSYAPAQLLAAGRDMECVALARAVRLYLERRVFINDNRTVVL